MKIILNREEIEDAIKAYIKDKILPYGDTRQINVVQERKVSGVVTFGEEHPERTASLPGLTEEDLEVSEPEVETEPEPESAPDVQINTVTEPAANPFPGT